MPRASKKRQTTSTATNSTPHKKILKTQPNMSISTSKRKHGKKMSRQQLCRALTEMGILTPAVMKIDMMRLLYEANFQERSKKRDDSALKSSIPSKDESDELVDMITASSSDEAEETQDQYISSQPSRHDQAHINYNYHDIDASDDEGQNDLNLLHSSRKHKSVHVKGQQVQTSKNVNHQSGKPFSLFSAPVAEECVHVGGGGLAGRGDSDIETVPKGLRKAILEGYNVNLVRLLLPRDNKKYSRDDDEDEDKSVYLRQKTDPRLDKNLTILEFILAFSRYINIVCEVFPPRRQELTAYMSDIIRLSSRFGHPFFYDYHRLFAQKAESMLQTRNILVDWSRRDHDIYLNVFSGLRPKVCDLCRSPDHTTYFCKKVLDRQDLIEKMLSDNFGRETDINSSLLFSSRRAVASENITQDSRATCKFFNGAGFGKCIQPECLFAHLCSRCRGAHSKKLCNQK